jgi:hypothetical protein
MTRNIIGSVSGRFWRSSACEAFVREHVQDDNHQDACGCQCRRGTEESIAGYARITTKDCRAVLGSSTSRLQPRSSVAQPAYRSPSSSVTSAFFQAA